MGLTLTAAIWALFVAIALWPPFRNGSLGFVVFLLTITVNEIPLVLLVVFVATTAPGALDEPSTWPAWPAAALSGLAVAGLVWLQVRARSTRPAMEAALTGALGSGWRDASPADSDRRWTNCWLRGILLPFQRHWRDVERLRNLPYGPDRAHRLDLYRGRSAGSERPVLIHLHGGGFTQGGKSHEGVVLLNQLAAHGWLCVSANYRLRSAGAFPSPLVDTKRVIAWIREHASDYGGDPRQIFLAGSSAGGHLAVSAALTPDRPEFQPGFADIDTRVAGVVVLYGYLGPRTSDRDSSPAALARPDAPPLLVIHGAGDTMVPPAGPRSVAGALRTASRAPVVWAELPDTQHDFDFFASVRARLVADEIEAFLEWARRRDPGLA
jgi:acetyl esterase/lipase